MQPLALGAIKLGFVFFYRRIFNVPSGCLNIIGPTSMASIALILLWTFGFSLAGLLECPGHVDADWGPSDVRLRLPIRWS